MPPSLVWDPSVKSYFESVFGMEQVNLWAQRLSTPPLKTCLRVNTLKSSREEVLAKLKALLGVDVSLAPYGLPAVLIHGTGPCSLDLFTSQGEVVCTRRTAEAVLKGAHLFAPGVLATTRGLGPSATVSVTVVANGEQLSRASLLEGSTDKASARFCIGLGTLIQAPTDIFSSSVGVAVELTQRLYNTVPCNSLLPGEVMLQSLPSLVAAHVLATPPGSLVLDMCAAPGGKTTAIAELMGDLGLIYALDRSHSKAAHITSLAAELGLKSISAHKLDATKACLPPCAERGLHTERDAGIMESRTSFPDPAIWEEFSPSQPPNVKEQEREEKRRATMTAMGLEYAPKNNPDRHTQGNGRLLKGFLPATFPYILLDAPCSALGLRPRLEQSATLEEIRGLAHYQRQLLEAAVKLLAPGGYLVYSTCTLNPGECEANVRHTLDSHPELSLVQQQPVWAGPGLVGSCRFDGERTEEYLTAAESVLVQRFDPSSELDTPGFFIAKFRKQKERDGGEV